MINITMENWGTVTYLDHKTNGLELKCFAANANNY